MPCMQASKPKGKTKRKGKQAISSSAMTQLTRPKAKKESRYPLTNGHVLREVSLDSVQPEVKEGRIFEVVLVSEGLGNRRNMNYYGPEAMQSGPPIFEGKPCFLNHASVSEEQDRPERTVEGKCGYFKNVHVIYLDNGNSALSGEFHTDLSESGKLAAEKLLTALHYQEESGGAEEYVGFSIAANGQTERRMVQTDEGEELEVNYVWKFTEAASCDLVTAPARGGKVVALIESKEVRSMGKKFVTTLESTLEDLKKAKESKDIKTREARLDSINKVLESILAKAKESSEDGEDSEDESSEDSLSRREDEDEAGYMGRMRKQGQAIAKILKGKQSTGGDAADSEDESGEDDAGGGGDDGSTTVKAGHKVTKTTTVKHDGPSEDGEDEDEDEQEAKRDAIKNLLKESQIPAMLAPMRRLINMPYREARAEISRLKNMREAWKADIMSVMPARGFSGTGAKDNNALFAEAVR